MALTDLGSTSLWSTFSDMERMLDDFNRVFGRSRQGRPLPGSMAPPMNIWANEDELVVTCEVPGVDPASLGITVMGDILTARGKRFLEDKPGDSARREGSSPRAGGDDDDVDRGSYSEFSRSIQLPFRVDPERTEARCRNGVLVISLRRPEAEKPRRIQISAS